MFLGYAQFPVIGKSGHKYQFNADAYPFAAPPIAAIFYLARMAGEPEGKVDCVRLYSGHTNDLHQELSRHKTPSSDDAPSPNAILWLPVENPAARLAIWNDLGELERDISRN